MYTILINCFAVCFARLYIFNTFSLMSLLIVLYQARLEQITCWIITVHTENQCTSVTFKFFCNYYPLTVNTILYILRWFSDIPQVELNRKYCPTSTVTFYLLVNFLIGKVPVRNKDCRVSRLLNLTPGKQTNITFFK